MHLNPHPLYHAVEVLLSATLKERRRNQMTPKPDPGIVTARCGHSVEQTVKKLEQLLQANGVKLFAVIDHSGEAESAGLHMPPTKLLIFGNPKAGTPLGGAAGSV